VLDNTSGEDMITQGLRHQYASFLTGTGWARPRMADESALITAASWLFRMTGLRDPFAVFGNRVIFPTQ